MIGESSRELPGRARRSWPLAARHAAARFVLLVLRLCAIPFRPLPRATIGNQLTLLSLVTTVPFLVLIIAWSIQDGAGAGRTLAGLAWATLAAIGLGVLSHRRLSLPIVQLARAAQRLGQGDFTVRAPFERGDELGELAGAMNVMTTNLAALTRELRGARDRLAATVEEVGRLATSGLDAQELWPLLTEIGLRLTSADGSALYLPEGDGSLKLLAASGLATWPARGDLARRLAGWRGEAPETALWVDRRMAVPVQLGGEAAVLEVVKVDAPFPEDTERLLAVFARQAGLALERTALRRQAAEAYVWEQTSRSQREFIALASHELNNPVAALRSYADALRRPEVIRDEEERRYCLERVAHLSERLGEIVRNLLSVSRIRAGQLQVAIATLPLADLLRGCAEDTRRREPGAALEVALPDDLPPALADPRCLEEIVLNLLSNALRYSPRGLPVRVWAEAAPGGRVRLHVRDEGPGLSAEQQGRLFRRYGRVDPDDRAGGLGLGLYICQTYAKLMQGGVWVSSAPGRGATFTVDLPAARSGGAGRDAAG